MTVFNGDDRIANNYRFKEREKASLLLDIVMIMEINVDSANETMQMGVMNADCIHMEVNYRDVCYNQIILTPEAERGRTMFFCEWLSVDEFLTPDHEESAARYATDTDDPDFSKLRELEADGHRICSHYMEYGQECIVLVRSVFMGALTNNRGPDGAANDN